MFRCLTVAAVALALAGAATAQSLRRFPQNALRGALVVVAPPEVTLNGEPARLGAGARIRGQDNLMQMSASLVGLKLLVHYTVDAQGLLREVWILTEDEAAKSPWPVTPEQAQAWSFDPAAQAWVKP